MRERQQTWGAIIILKFILFCWGVAQGLVYVLSTCNTEFHSAPPWIPFITLQKQTSLQSLTVHLIMQVCTYILKIRDTSSFFPVSQEKNHLLY